MENCAALFEEGATIPFISRYRKERTGGLDDVAVAEIRHWTDVFVEMEKRKETVLETISNAGALTADLRKRIECDLYRQRGLCLHGYYRTELCEEGKTGCD